MAERLGPNHPHGIKRINVGCGPHNHLSDWWNVDIRTFRGVDEVMDAARPWPWTDIEYVYGEHFLEHLPLDKAINFLIYAGQSLKVGGTLRLSTPNLEWVMNTHFTVEQVATEKRLMETLKTNRAFHGWGHHFLYTKEMLEYLLCELGYIEVGFYSYGESNNPDLRNLERHGGFVVAGGYPSVIVVEASRGEGTITLSPKQQAFLNEHYLRYVASGH